MSVLFALDPGISFFDAMMQDMARRLASNLSLRCVTLADKNEGFNLVCVDGVTPGDSPDVRVYVREQDRHRNDAAPCVCCVPLGGDILPPDVTGGAQPITLNGKRVSVQAIRDRVFNTRVYIWGQDRAQAEVLLGQLILAFHGFHNAIQFSEEVWEDQQEGQGGPMTAGSMISFLTSIRLMVSDLPTRLVKVLSIKATVDLLGQNTEIDIP